VCLRLTGAKLVVNRWYMQSEIVKPGMRTFGTYWVDGEILVNALDNSLP
jgi:hypothetical protein